MPHRERVATAIVGLVAAALMVAAARGDLWLDEIWSLDFARHADGLAGVFRLQHDNNHVLNTLYLKALGPGQPALLYRLLAVLSGFGSLVVAARLARPWGRYAACCTLALLGSSFPLLLYFSEARGYGPSMFLALVAWSLVRSGALRAAIPFWLVSILGVLAHATFAIVSLSCMAYGAVAGAPDSDRSPESAGVRPEGSAWRRRALRFGAFHLVPALFLAAWYLLFARDMQYGGGPVQSIPDVLGRGAALLLALPEAQGALALTVACLLSLLGVAVLARRRDPEAVFYASVLGLAPALLIAVTQPRYFYFRYVLVCFPFFLLLLARLLVAARERTGYRWLPAAAVALMAAAQLGRVDGLVLVGRGQYRAAVARILASGPGAIATVTSDHDVRSKALLGYYAPPSGAARRLVYVPQSQWREVRPDWLLDETEALDAVPDRAIGLPGGDVYDFVDDYRHAGVSGWTWFLYRRRGAAEAAGASEPSAVSRASSAAAASAAGAR